VDIRKIDSILKILNKIEKDLIRLNTIIVQKESKKTEVDGKIIYESLLRQADEKGRVRVIDRVAVRVRVRLRVRVRVRFFNY
jgi:hypothetical protein